MLLTRYISKGLGIVLFVLLANLLHAQYSKDTSLVQFSGQVMTEEDGKLIVLPYTNIEVVGTNRGTYSNYQGFFSIVVRKGEHVVFSYIGFKEVEYTIPDSLRSDRYAIYQLMTRDTVNLPVTVIYPWPSREHFKQEFLALDVKDELKERAMENLSADKLAELAKGLPADGKESSSLYFRQQAAATYAKGQLQPQNLFNVFAWKQFFDAWKAGKYKRNKE
ncbi:MAG: carboxypeptidase-like regulatory domain-containing protein [Saprospiraceae bacterium]